MLRVATRGSRLARWQAEHVVGRLGVPAELVIVSTEGDRRADVPLHELGGQGVFVKDVQQAVLDGRADVAVHSAKDLPSVVTPGLAIGAVLERGDPRDALVGAALDALPAGAVVATGSVRRRAQLAAARPDLRFAPLRGNIETRLARAAEHDAIVVALVALARLGLADRADDILDPARFVPQVGQGALAVECRADEDDEVLELLRRVDHPVSRRAVETERAFLATLGGGCDLPCGAHAVAAPGGMITLDAMLASPDGATVLRAHEQGDDPTTVGTAAAHAILDGAGGRALLEARA